LKKALGKEATPSRWIVLYLGSGIKGGTPTPASPLQFVDRKGDVTTPPSDIEGVIVLDGTWSQAKALWWRNAWLLKLHRAILTPSRSSLYRELRKEPRRECLSTVETLAETLVALGEPEQTGEELRSLFSHLLDKQRIRLKERRQSKP
jgi:DTW domain-containing protein YfiP